MDLEKDKTRKMPLRSVFIYLYCAGLRAILILSL